MHNRKALTTNRHGAVLVVAMVCLLVITAIIGTMIRGTLRNHRQLRSEKDLRQTELLVDAGVARASKRLAADPEYRNETWSLPPDAITESGEGRVTIELTASAARGSLTARISAEYPIGNEHSVRRSRIVQLPTK
jgi:type II secretory pathway component PulK